MLVHLYLTENTLLWGNLMTVRKNSDLLATGESYLMWLCIQQRFFYVTVISENLQGTDKS